MTGRFRHQDAEHSAPSGAAPEEVLLGEAMRGERAALGKSLLDVQRELKIKAAYIAAIEDADPSVFEAPGFVAGYVRSYARYLRLDPEWAFAAFCAESGFAPARRGSGVAAGRAASGGIDAFGGRHLGMPPPREGFLSRIEPGAIGSLVVLAGLIGLLGYGGYAVLGEIQKVQLVPAEEVPEVVAGLDPLDEVQVPEDGADPEVAMLAGGFDRLYRPDPLEVPVIVARDGPIAALDPDEIGTLAAADSRAASSSADFATAIVPLPGAGDRVPDATDRAVLAALGEGLAGLSGGPEDPRPQVVADTPPEVTVFAVRPSWVRIRAADGTTLYEAIMQEGDRFVLPATEEPATLRTGESGAIYFSVDGTAYGPAGRPGAVTGGLSLAAATLKEGYPVADPQTDTALARVVVNLQADPPRRPGAAAPAAE